MSKPRLKWAPRPPDENGEDDGERLCLGPWELGWIRPSSFKDAWFAGVKLPQGVVGTFPSLQRGTKEDCKRRVEEHVWEFFVKVKLDKAIPHPRGVAPPREQRNAFGILNRRRINLD